MATPDRPCLLQTLAIAVVAQANGQYCCQITPASVGQPGETHHFYGQTPNHAIAIALETLATTYRQLAENEQQIAWDATQLSESGTPVQQHYHVIVHYEQIATETSKFEALQNTVLGNTIVENAQITLIQIDPDLTINPIVATPDL